MRYSALLLSSLCSLPLASCKTSSGIGGLAQTTEMTVPAGDETADINCRQKSGGILTLTVHYGAPVESEVWEMREVKIAIRNDVGSSPIESTGKMFMEELTPPQQSITIAFDQSFGAIGIEKEGQGGDEEGYLRLEENDEPMELVCRFKV